MLKSMCMHDTQTDHDRKSGNAAKTEKPRFFVPQNGHFLGGRDTILKLRKTRIIKFLDRQNTKNYENVGLSHTNCVPRFSLKEIQFSWKITGRFQM